MRKLIVAVALGLAVASSGYAQTTSTAPAKPAAKMSILAKYKAAMAAKKAAAAKPTAATPAMTTGAMAKPMSTAKTSTTAPNGKPRTAISLQCSAQADSKGLHGKARDSFRRKCMKG